MSFVIIDRRKNDKGKSTDNRHRFFNRVKSQVRDAMKQVIANGSIKDIVDGSSKKIRIPGKGLNKPFFSNSRTGGERHIVAPGNKKFIAGDRIRRSGQGEKGDGEGAATKSGEGEDSFSFSVTKEEFDDIFFGDLELPNLTKKNITLTEKFVTKRAGFATEGNKLNVVRTMRTSRARRVALRSKKKKKLEELEKQYNELLREPILNDNQKKKLRNLELEIKELKRRIKAVPFIDTMDERYNRWEMVPVPVTKAVIFVLMDVSGSMGEPEKNLAKRFFMLLYWFLTRTYEIVDIVYVRHTQIAEEVNEQDFFYSRKTGGTVVSSGLELINEIIEKRYPLNEWNMYTCQASDGDNWPDDSQICTEILEKTILPKMQYFAYVQIERRRSNPEMFELWNHYKTLSNKLDNFDMVSIKKASDIPDVFEKLFEKRGN
jgi:hypothetical protein